MDVQALRYPAMVSAMAFEQVVDAHEAYLAKGGLRRRRRSGRGPRPHVDDPDARSSDPCRRWKPAWQAPLEGWPQPRACTTSPAAIRAWACQFMIADLARRYSAACPGRPASTSCAYAASSSTANEEPGQCNSARVLHRGSLTLVVSMVPPGP